MKRDHEQFTSWLPRGCANAAVQALKRLEGLNIRVGVANEFPSVVGMLTSCPENFDGALKREMRDQNLRCIIEEKI
jgi:hypothetical protein